MLRNFFKYFNLSRTEQNGFFVLFLMILVFISFPYFYNFLHPTDFDSFEIRDFTEDTSGVNSRHYKRTSGEWANSKGSASNQLKTAAKLFPFDPNRLDEDGWKRLGLSDKQVRVILNYRNKGGQFYKKEDLAKIYSISPDEFKRLQDFIVIEQVSAYKQEEEKQEYQTVQKVAQKEFRLPPPIIDVNLADTTAFIKLRGIGSVFANRIVSYRKSLGGFVTVQQIKEIYGLPLETFEAIFPYLKISSDPMIYKLNINDLDVKSLAKHPYINYKQGTAIVNYRIQHGRFQNMEDLRKVLLLDDDFLRKLAPYLTF
ncbi:ComEA family DNA-binding protein [Sphingobacterium faecium]|uniref:ComEA family DNA-binding protein n=1 Tax=Sphingobacterium faecium TaxID=34087 RepID=UPI0024682EA3|nr:helix-hairpin-helix domain-containing protein [Sphingobacterium faecium]MDH5827272.1 helix-hairpin-helix domain-containing protein [Sphingobacterium faecium]